MERHITDEDGGLSTAISSAANGLKNKLNVFWLRLKAKSNDLACSSDCIPLLRYRSNFMPTEAEIFLLICSLFPDGFRVPIDELVTCGMGIGLFEDVDDMFAVRCRVHEIISIINGLKYPRKAIDGKIRLASEKDGPWEQYVKMLDGGHDLAKSIASTHPLVFRREIIIEKWPASNHYEDCYGLLVVLKKVNVHSVNLKCRYLTMLQLQYREDSQSIPVDFFEGMKELRVLSLDVPSLPQSLNVLRNLRTLRLKAPKLEDMSWIGDLKKLEFLSMSVLSLTDVPMEIGQLENLRLLDLRKMNIAYIPTGVLSRLVKLEELYFPLSFRRWGCKPTKHDDYDEWDSGKEDNSDDEERINANISEIHDGERINASLTEIVSLSLNALQITVPKASLLPKKSAILKNIREFKILLPNNVKYQLFGKGLINELQLTGEACDIKDSGICDLMSRTESLSLSRVRNLKNVMNQLEDDDFSELKKMIISECDELEYVVDRVRDYLFMRLECLHLSMLYNLKEIFHGSGKSLQGLPNLSHVSIRFCHKLKYVFPLSIIRGSMLKSIEILDCNEMEGIFYEDNNPFTLHSIEKLEFHSLPRLISLLVHKDNMTNEVHDDCNESLTTSKIVSNYTEGPILVSDGNCETCTSILKESCNDDKECIWAQPSSTSGAKLQRSVTPQPISRKQVSVIKNKDGIGHMKMYGAFPSKLAEKLQNLRRLKIAFCDAVKVVFLFEEEDAAAFNSLKELELHGLRNLVHIWFHFPPKLTAFLNLQLLVLSECPNLYLFSSRVAKLLVQLKKIYISRCEKMEEILKDDENVIKGNFLFPRLKLLELQCMPNLRTFFDGIHEIKFPLLESLKLNQCNKMKCFSYGSLWTPMLERIEINESLYSLMGDLNAPVMRWKENSHCRSFSFSDMMIATKKFRRDNLLGEGGFSTYYKGWIDETTFAPSKTRTGMPVAIKKLDAESDEQFVLEVNILGRLLHPNLIECIGYCREDGHLLIVYEFMERGNLGNHLFKRKSLSWDKRLKIAIGVARGLDFLHTSEMEVIHTDINSSVILLDNNYNAKISGFGLACSLASVDTTLLTEYSDYGTTRNLQVPEYIATGVLHVKTDVYSFGMVLLELMTGLRALDRNRPQSEQDLVKWLKPILSEKRKLRNIIDVTIKGQYSLEAMSLAAQLSLKCLKSNPEQRPSMKEVVDALEQIAAI